jgi:hypothetical protein
MQSWPFATVIPGHVINYTLLAAARLAPVS